MGNSGQLPAPLPEDIIREILHRLPVKCLVRFSGINSSWRKLLLSDQSFVYSHLKHAKNNNINRLTDVLIYSDCYPDYLTTLLESDDELAHHNLGRRDIVVKFKNTALRNPLHLHQDFLVVGCCNGIICLYRKGLFLWNPALRECRALPTCADRWLPDLDFIVFGYDCRNQDYKVLKKHRGQQRAELYSLNRNSWKLIGCDGLSVKNNPSSLTPHSQELDGRLFWISECTGDGSVRSLISFNVSTERFNEFPIPDSVPPIKPCGAVGVFRGCISVLTHREGNRQEYEVWSMKEYGVSESWTRALVVRKRGRLRTGRPVGFTGNGKIVVQWRRGACLYDPSLKRWEKFDMKTKSYMTYRFFVGEYVESLVSIMPPRRRRRWRPLSPLTKFPGRFFKCFLCME
ncbi:UNVERIFIED_CONTAM: putative F-box protein [Sesamum radiatum]|uniref:F-box protein n=1 Tax=Sesamum radiatum TaxID=300843 RepID=A0AAW2VS32_SESRA